MKISIRIVSFCLMLALFACGPKGKKVEATDAKATTQKAASTSFTLNKGILNWTGSKLMGTSSHSGTINVSSGIIGATGTNITSGKFMIDMNTIINTDQEPGQGKEKLEGHLKSPDFFDVQQFPSASFEITDVAPVTGNAEVTHNITGNLTMKGIAKSISIPANVAIIGNKLTAVTPAFKIDRTQWGIEYGTSSIAGIAKDRIISNDIALVLNLEATASGPVQ